MEEMTAVLNRKVETRLRECLKHLMYARTDLQEEHTIPTAHMASIPAKHALGMIQDVEDNLNELLEKLEVHPELDEEWRTIHEEWRTIHDKADGEGE
tara:strand:+ start:1492 stop:1782 length:291 start_codon:yes stop_codon:yes gene_type:complete